MGSLDLDPNNWSASIRNGIAELIGALSFTQSPPESVLPEGHLIGTPDRFVGALRDSVRGSWTDPKDFLQVYFDAHYDQMLHVERIIIRSLCAHHLSPIVGKAHFAYIPANGRVVGLSKIPRFIDTLARRLQVQEILTQQIVDTFQEHVQPVGCAVHIRAYHFCMMVRGVEEPHALTTSTALTGVFKTDSTTRQEFLMSINQQEPVFP